MNKQKIKHGPVMIKTGNGKAKAHAALIEMIELKHPCQNDVHAHPGIEF